MVWAMSAVAARNCLFGDGSSDRYLPMYSDLMLLKIAAGAAS
jgi:hypothetical protein